MTWFAASATGFGVGLVSFGGLWLTVRQLVRRPRRQFWLGVSGLARLLLIGLAFFALCREGPDMLLAGLGGLWLARYCLIRSCHGEARRMTGEPGRVSDGSEHGR
jgi:F1F0 ATPase subunit 2